MSKRNPEPIIEVNNLSKIYPLGKKEKYYTLRDMLAKTFDPKNWLNKKNHSTNKDEFLALKNVSFKIYPGEIVGVVGRNGAGKSTLLKILGRVTHPTSGSAILRGRVGSLLEVGTGFHQELTGRENIFLNGAILGMTQKEIKEKFNQIVKFAEISKFLDTPVKHYSSGMYVRLAFAIASQLEPEILLVDEVLAVGDAQFQKKSIKKMGSVVKDSSRTILFVSHNMGAIKSLCQRAIFIDNGTAEEMSIDSAVEKYLSTGNENNIRVIKFKNENKKDIQFEEIKVVSKKNDYISAEEDITIKLQYRAKRQVAAVYLSMYIENSNGVKVIFTDDHGKDIKKVSAKKKGKYLASVIIPGNLLSPGCYFVSAGIASYVEGGLDSRLQSCSFTIKNKNNTRGAEDHPAVLDIPLNWKTHTI